jgi:thiosulfate/3-mercaptopyruvate sulfurtransferase
MNFETLISTDQLASLLENPSADVLVFDCTFDLDNPDARVATYQQVHLPNAIYLDMRNDLSGVNTGRNGRHPLPTREYFSDTLARAGANCMSQLVSYDRTGGNNAARLWWMARWIGHRNVAVLDGGLAKWLEDGLPVQSGPITPRATGDLVTRESLVESVNFDDVRENVDTRARIVIDARTRQRFRGENETIDAKAGHIPHALNSFFRENLGPDGRFKARAELHQEFTALTGTSDGKALISQCGSGLAACHNLLALELAGIQGAALYAGSWSEWSLQSGAPVAKGD